MLADYNRWANERIYAAAEKLSQADYFADRGAFFGSLHRTLSHILIGDRVWLRRFTGRGPSPSQLDEVPFDDLQTLAAARLDEDERLVAFVRSLDDDALAADIRYRAITQPIETTAPLAAVLTHVFHHQTHHRGQAHTLLTIANGKEAAPALDLVLFQLSTGIAKRS